MPGIDPLSGSSLFVELLCPDGSLLGSATGFTASFQDKTFLITNWHVVSGRNPVSDCGKPPKWLRIYHHGQTLGTWLTRAEALLLRGRQIPC